MAFITFLVRRKPIAVHRLSGFLTMGRSLECDIYIPDVFVSREHCRFEQRNGSWHIVRLEGRNGIWFEGKRYDDYLLKPGDVIEIGTIAFKYNEGEPDGPSNPAPYGMGLGVTELMDTVFAQELRPSHYSKKQAGRKKEWMERARLRVAHADRDVDVEPVVDTEPWNREEWAELDLETQVVAAQTEMTDWDPPIFNPRQKGISVEVVVAAGSRASTGAAMRGTEASVGGLRMAAGARDVGQADYGLSDVPLSGRTAREPRQTDSIDEEVERVVGRMGTPKPSASTAQLDRPRQVPQAAKRSWLPFGRKAAVVDGVAFEAYTWRDRLADSLRDRARAARGFAKLNPTLAIGLALAGIVVVAVALRFTPGVGVHSGPHVWVPETPEEMAIYGKHAKPTK